MKQILASVLCMVLLSGCYRARNTLLPDAPPVFTIYAEHGNFADSSLTYTVKDSGSIDIRLNFTTVSGNPADYPITCFISGLPPGVATPDPITFKLNDLISFRIAANVLTGTYPFYINVKTQAGLKSYKELLHVLPVADGAPGLVGSYSGSDPCGHFSYGETWHTYSATVDTVAGHPHWVAIRNFSGLGDSVVVYAFVSLYNPGTGQNIDIPLQTVAGYTIVGRGKGYWAIDDNKKGSISIYGDTIIHGIDTQTCMTQLR